MREGPRAHGLFEGLLPQGARAADCFGDPAGLRPHPEEEAQLGGAVVDRRRREFTTARWCARTALAAAGAPAPVGPLPRGARGEPLWPEGFTGSITHRAGYRAAVAIAACRVGALGIDAERALPLRPAVADAIASREERAQLAALPRTPQLPWDTLLFSVKEAVYKAWYPLAGHRRDARPLTFRSARVTFRPTAYAPLEAGAPHGATGSLIAEPAGPARGARPELPVLLGRYRAAAGLLVCVVHSRPSA